ncbi:hypothetical protein LXL04_025568 [Taraxacum kok-saghyz]
MLLLSLRGGFEPGFVGCYGCNSAMDSKNRVINADHELAPNLFNHRKGETEDHMNKALHVGALSYARSNSTSRTTRIETLGDLSGTENKKIIRHVSPCFLTSEILQFLFQYINYVLFFFMLNHQWKTNPTMPKIPRLQTSLRPRDMKVRISKKLEKEKPEKAPNFKARPLNKKILESKGELGMLCNKKRQVTKPKEFHFAISKRIPPQTTTNDAKLYEKITLGLKSHNKKVIPRNTISRPFHFHTEKRRAQKESKFVVR